jgi:hypothetical protein
MVRRARSQHGRLLRVVRIVFFDELSVVDVFDFVVGCVLMRMVWIGVRLSVGSGAVGRGAM